MSKPLILNYYDYDATQHDKYMLKENKKVCFKIKCKYCPQSQSGCIDVTSNWIAHLRKHKLEFEEFLAIKNKQSQVNLTYKI